MKTTKRFDMAVQALVQAYFNETLRSGDCSACAVGNIVAHSRGVKVQKLGSGSALIGINSHSEVIKNSDWNRAFVTMRVGRGSFQKIIQTCFTDEGVVMCLEKTGYSAIEMAKVEFAFESNTKIHAEYYHRYSKERISNDQLNGLFAVVDVLCELDGIEDSESIKSLFTTKEV